MVRKIQKTKAATKTGSSVKNTKTKNKVEILSNGYEESTSNKPEHETNGKTESKTDQQNKELDNISEAHEDMRPEENAETNAPSATDTVVNAPQKRKSPSTTETVNTTVKTKAKRQKVLLEVPEISSVSGKVFVIGENDVGQLGLGDDITEKKRPALLELPQSIVDIAAGGMHSICLTESGEVITFGCNDEGALGRVTTEEGSEYIPRRIDIPERIVQISVGDSHSAALSESGQVYIWGNFRSVNGPIGLITDDTKQNTPVKILNNIIIVKIASGSDHLVCLSQEGVVYTCGCGEAGQLGRVHENASVDGGRKGIKLLLLPDKISISKSVKSGFVNDIWTGSYNTFVRTKESGSIYAFGLNNFCQLGCRSREGLERIFKPQKISSFDNKSWLQINGDQQHTLALDDEGLVYSFGRGNYGRLGLGENIDTVSEPTVIPLLQDKNCIDISSGNCVSFAVSDDGNVFSWGMGTNHQLGHGNDDDQLLPQLIEGSFLNSWKAFKISGGGQHTLILAHPRNSSKEK